MDLKKILEEGMDWIYVAQDRGQLWVPNNDNETSDSVTG
jgi:hypothetical protein